MTPSPRLLFTPIRVGSRIVRNRIVFCAHLTNFAEDNMPSEKHADYYGERAAGGVGLIVTEEQSVHPTDHPYEKLIDAYNPAVVPGYRRITERVHSEGALILAQLNHNGGQSSGLYTRLPVWAPSSLADPMFREVPKAMERDDIREVIAGYAQVAQHTLDGGFDGVELQCSHSSLVRQFLSRQSNRRTDEYGGNLPNRMRILREIIEAIRQSVGRSYILGVRLCGDELMDEGIVLEETLETAKALESDGLIDYINTSIGTATQSLYMIEGSMDVPPGYAVFVADAIRGVVDLPVIGVGRIKDPVQAEHILSDGHADLIGIVRGQICDAEFARKARENRVDDIRLCISCNQECVGRMGLNRWLGCLQNPAAGREGTWGKGSLKPALRSKLVLVIGGGPAGLKAAVVAARRGHRVILAEGEGVLGGRINLASKIASRSELGDLVRNLLHELEKVNVEVRLGVTVTVDTVMSERPDAVVIATGSTPDRNPFPGARASHVLDITDILADERMPGANVAIVDQLSTHEASSVAEYLAERGCRVNILTSALYVGQGLGTTLDLEIWTRRACKLGIVRTPNVSVVGIEGGVLKAVHNYSGQVIEFPSVDAIVSVCPPKPKEELYFALKGRISEIYRIGDCIAPRRANSAILEGEQVGRLL